MLRTVFTTAIQVISISLISFSAMAEARSCKDVTESIMKSIGIPIKDDKSAGEFSVRDYSMNGVLPSWEVREKESGGGLLRASKKEDNTFEVVYSPNFHEPLNKVSKYRFKVVDEDKCEFTIAELPNIAETQNRSKSADSIQMRNGTTIVTKDECDKIITESASARTAERKGSIKTSLASLQAKVVCFAVASKEISAHNPGGSRSADIPSR